MGALTADVDTKMSLQDDGVGYFLGLKDDYELREAKRALNGALDRIVPRAA